MTAEIHPAEDGLAGELSLKISGSKSESNRLLILRALYPKISIQNLSDSDDTRVMLEALENAKGLIDIHHAGTSMRFLTAFFSARPGSSVTLTGSQRMRERPISVLVDALRELGAEIKYTGEKGYPPLAIRGNELNGGSVSIKAGTSSQYISALLLIAPALENGLLLSLQGKVTSRPYIDMTLSLLEKLGATIEQQGNRIRIYPLNRLNQNSFTVESDWSSASYFYSLVALNPKLTLTLSSYGENSLQGDVALCNIYRQLGVETNFDPLNNSMTLHSTDVPLPELLELDLRDTPDIAQTLAVSCVGLQVPCRFSGLHTLKIKETDRLQALKNEIEKLGSKVKITDDTLEIDHPVYPDKRIVISTYNDHRMAMAFAPLGSMIPILIDDPSVVSKSFPTFWELLKSCGLSVNFKR